ncbi:MAG: ABC transporter ATP-binding protein [Psychrobacillus psychrodurans]|uniref:ABC transporter ATP-binding protein n=1 Tax=Psychrobacillus sp. MER TA 171 TaxID=2939577 RepID=UPI00204184BA|nr:ABC transporter ATP-binding protein [Psychrobacillus sp. MER TA 171]MCM3357154.1 ABC transporter ATP-binding protein [Psychrobacillus sp. MER TA 171]
MTIQLHNVTKVFKENRGIFDISFTLRPGDITAIVGSNGAGKSTIINILTNSLSQDSGDIIRESPDARYMPDDIEFPDTLTAEEIIRFLGHLKRVPIKRQAELLEKVGLSEVKRLKIGQFSKGMRQRLNLAQSLIGDSQLYILDEPTNGLDPYWIARLKVMLEEERANNQIVLFSTHLLSLAEEIANQVILIHNGRILATGEIQQLLHRGNCQTLEQLWLQMTEQKVVL